MKAILKSEDAPGLTLEDVPEPEMGINDVLIEVDRTGICGTDLHIYNWDAWAQKTIPVPMVVGHEFVGRVIDAGSNVTDFHPGDLVSGEGHVVCGRCRNCLAGRRHQSRGRGLVRPAGRRGAGRRDWVLYHDPSRHRRRIRHRTLQPGVSGAAGNRGRAFARSRPRHGAAHSPTLPGDPRRRVRVQRLLRQRRRVDGARLDDRTDNRAL